MHLKWFIFHFFSRGTKDGCDYFGIGEIFLVEKFWKKVFVVFPPRSDAIPTPFLKIQKMFKIQYRMLLNKFKILHIFILLITISQSHIQHGLQKFNMKFSFRLENVEMINFDYFSARKCSNDEIRLFGSKMFKWRN